MGRIQGVFTNGLHLVANSASCAIPATIVGAAFGPVSAMLSAPIGLLTGACLGQTDRKGKIQCAFAGVVVGTMVTLVGAIETFSTPEQTRIHWKDFVKPHKVIEQPAQTPIPRLEK